MGWKAPQALASRALGHDAFAPVQDEVLPVWGHRDVAHRLLALAADAAQQVPRGIEDIHSPQGLHHPLRRHDVLSINEHGLEGRLPPQGERGAEGECPTTSTDGANLAHPPGDYRRFTAAGLRLLLRDWSHVEMQPYGNPLLAGEARRGRDVRDIDHRLLTKVDPIAPLGYLCTARE